MTLRLKRIGTLTLLAGLFATALWIVAFGGLIFCCSVRRSGSGFWEFDKVFYGLGPVVLGTWLINLVARRWLHGFGNRRNGWIALCLVAMLICVFDLALFVMYRSYRNQYDDNIHLAWNPQSHVFSWGPGSVRIPSGFEHQPAHGIDTLVGDFISTERKLVIRYDIGDLAGEHGGIGGMETLNQGARVRSGQTISDLNGVPKTFAAVSFPDSGCANFFLESLNKSDAVLIEEIGKSYRPLSRTPAWLKPLLPEILRTDCRYRFQLPGY